MSEEERQQSEEEAKRVKEEETKRVAEEEKRAKEEYEKAARLMKSLKHVGEREFEVRMQIENEAYLGTEIPPEVADARVREEVGRIVLEEDQRSLVSYDVEPDFHGVLHLFVIIEVT